MYVNSCNADMSHTVGNVTYMMTEYVKGLFPADFFRHTHVSSRMPFREFGFEENRENSSFIRKNKPILIIRPRADLTNDDVFLSRSFFTRNIIGSTYNKDYSNYQKILRDNVNDITLSFLMNRIRVPIGITMMFDTEYQQRNVFSYLLNMFNDGQVYRMNTALEVYVPQYCIDTISEISGVPIRNQAGTVRDFLNYLTMNSNKNFTFKENTANSKEAFFLYYPLTMEYVFTDFNADELVRKGDVSDNATISFTLNTEFNTVGMYQISTERDDVKLKANAVVDFNSTDGIQVLPHFTVTNLFDEVDKNGWKMFYSNMFEVDGDLPPKEPDILDLSSVFKESSLQEVLDYHEKHGISNDILFNFIIMKNNTRLNNNRSVGKLDYVTDLPNQRILIYNKNSSSTYRIVIYVNNLYINQLMLRIGKMDEVYEKDIKER